jgi:hypothetical protein
VNPLRLADEALLAQCTLDRFRGSGPGGQKRNKTESAVRLRHRPTALSATASESRSQHENRRRALRRLRQRLAAEVRRPVDLTRYEVPTELRALCGRAGARLSARDPAFALAVQQLLDLFAALGASVADTAARLGLSTAATSKLLLGEDWIARAANALREARRLSALRR